MTVNFLGLETNMVLSIIKKKGKTVEKIIQKLRHWSGKAVSQVLLTLAFHAFNQKLS